MEIRTKGIVIRATEVGESDKLVTLLTPEYGQLTVRAKGCRSQRSKLRFAALPMCFGEYLLTHTKVGHIVTACDSIDTFVSISDDLTRFYVANVVLEGAEKLSREGTADPTLFLTVLNTLKKVAYHEGVLQTGAYYLCELMRLSGHAVRPMCDCGAEGDFVDLETGALCCAAHRGPLSMPLSPDTREGLLDLLDGLDVSTPQLRDAYVILARCLFHTVGVKLNAVQALCKQWSVLAV